jgi:hypothetical protein
MHRRAIRWSAISLAALLAWSLGGCATTPTAAQPAGTPVYDAWTTPPQAGVAYSAQPVQNAALQAAPVQVGQGAPQQPAPMADTGTLPPPPPPPDASIPVAGAPAASSTAPCPPPCPTPAAPLTPARVYNGCWPPCNDGISMWHARILGGPVFSAGTDHFDSCIYYGLDVGRTFCGCWGLDAYLRYNSGRFDRGLGAQAFKDGGEWYHAGAKVTFEKSFGRSSKLFAWGGLGAGYFTTKKYVRNDSGFEVFGEAGLGYNLSRNWAVRAGLNVHGMSTDVTRRDPANDGQSRWLWILAPVVELEGRF